MPWRASGRTAPAPTWSQETEISSFANTAALATMIALMTSDRRAPDAREVLSASEASMLEVALPGSHLETLSPAVSSTGSTMSRYTRGTVTPPTWPPVMSANEAPAPPQQAPAKAALARTTGTRPALASGCPATAAMQPADSAINSPAAQPSCIMAAMVRRQYRVFPPASSTSAGSARYRKSEPATAPPSAPANAGSEASAAAVLGLDRRASSPAVVDEAMKMPKPATSHGAGTETARRMSRAATACRRGYPVTRLFPRP
jgi:hypothetical protein